MLKSGKTVISVPADRLQEAAIPGSLFEAAKLRTMPIPEDLKRAVDLVSMQCNEPMCIVRPEIFTHGAARQWLDERLGPVRHHVCVSDGSSVKAIDGLENHLFLYELGERRGAVGFQNLLTWAPEFFTNLSSQINSFHGVALNGRLVQPPTTLLLPRAKFAGVMPGFFEFFLSRHSPEESSKVILAKGAVPAPALADFGEVLYVPFTEASAHDSKFAKLVARAIAVAYFRPEQCLLIRLPRAHDSLTQLSEQIIVATRAFCDSGVVLPRVPAKNIFLIDRDMPESFFEFAAKEVALSLLIDESFDFWRYTRDFYTDLRGVRYLFDGDRRKLQRVVQTMTDIFRRPPVGTAALPAFPPFLLNWRQSKSAMTHRS